jgi:hypothetical protein
MNYRVPGRATESRPAKGDEDMKKIDYGEVVDLHGLPADTPYPATNAQTYYAFGKTKTTTLEGAVREVVERWTPLRKASAMILRAGGKANLEIEGIIALYKRSDFPGPP